MKRAKPIGCGALHFYRNEGKIKVCMYCRYVELNKTKKKMNKKKIYISGKITGMDMEVATQLFKDAAKYSVETMGYKEAVNPMDLCKQDDTWEWIDYMRVDLKALVDCDAILILNNWEDSKGARVEVELAKGLDMDIYYL